MQLLKQSPTFIKANHGVGRRVQFVSLVSLLAMTGLVLLFWLLTAVPSQAQTAVRYVTVGGSGTACTTAAPCPLRTAVNLSTDGDEVRVAAGTYTADSGATAVITVSAAITLSGGYNPANWADPPDRDANQTTLDGQDAAQVVRILGTINPAIENFHITNGRAGAAVNGQGGGIYNGSGSPLIRNNAIYDNHADNYGGGIFDSGGATIIGNDIYNNQTSANWQGGGIAVAGNGVHAFLELNQIYNNSAPGNGNGGGVMLRDGATATLNANAIHNNQAANGGGLYAFNAVTLYSNLFYENQASVIGGGLVLVGSSTLWNNTIADNSAASDGGGIAIYANSSISNTIVAFNSGGGTNGIFVASGAVTGGYNNIYGNSSSSIPFTHSIDGDPLFVNQADDNYRITFGSPNRDAGSPSTPAAVNIDFEGQTRPYAGSPMDVGADEYYPDFAAFDLTPAALNNIVERNSNATFIHTLRNQGTVADTYTFTCATDPAWLVITCPPATSLPVGGSANVQTTIFVPESAPALSVGRTTITATSTFSSATFHRAIVDSTVNPRPGLNFTPNYSQTVLPGDTITLTHVLTNTGDAVDTFTISLVPGTGTWAELLPSNNFQLTVPSGSSRLVRVRVTVPEFAPAGLSDVTQIRATSGYDTAVFATVTDNITARPTVGTRYVTTAGDDVNNNCTQITQPCLTIAHAIGQASFNDAVSIARGTYTESGIPLNDTIHLSGGWTTNFLAQGEPDLTVIDANGSTFIFNVAPGTAVRPTIANLTLQNGNNAGPGGAVLVGNSAQPAFTNVIFQNNQGTQGGAIYAGQSALLTVRQSWFYTNTATINGGAIYVQNSTVVLAQNSFHANSAPSANGQGGALFMNNGFLSAENNLFHNNAANSHGGALYLGSGQISVWNNTFVQNTAGGNGGALYNQAANGVVVANTLLIANTAASGGAIHVNGGALTLSYSDYWQNSAAELNGVTLGTGNIQQNPLFADTLFRLQRGSPALDVGAPNTPVTVDFEDDPRPADNGYDMGYDELAGCRAQRDGILQPFGSIQDAMAATASSTLIRVTGICRGVNTYEVNGQPIQQTVFITQSFTIQGGWNNDFTARSDVPTIIDPEESGRAFYISGAIAPVLEELTIVHGDASGLGGGPAGEDAGGAVYNADSSAIFVDVRILSSTATLGGGFYNHTGAPTFRSSTPVGATERALSPFAHIANNTAATAGGGVYNHAGALHLGSTRIYSNTAVSGGGLYNNLGSIVVTNTVVYVNTASGHGGGVYNNAPLATFQHLTVYSNTAELNGGGFYNAAGASALRNTIFDNNRAASGPAIFAVSGSTPNVDYNYYYGHLGTAVVGVAPGANSYSGPIPPGFTDAPGGNFHLTNTANAIDLGDPASPITRDFDNDPRPSNQGPDMGADEVVGCLVSLNGVIYGNIQAALDVAVPGDLLRVAGTCSGVHPYNTGSGGGCGGDTGNILVTVHLTKSVTLQGGWDPLFTEQEDVTTLDARGLGRVLYIGPGVTATVDSFHIINGLVSGSNGNGAGICIDHATPTIINNEIYSHTATNGGAIYSLNSAAVIDGGNRVYSNTATSGAAVYVANTAGAVTTVQNNFVYANTAVNGGAFYNAAGANNFFHNTIYSNTASNTGGAFYAAANNPSLINNIVISNTAAAVGGAYGAPGSTPVVNHNDFYGQAVDFGGTIVNGGAGHLNVDPQFTDLAALDFSLPYISPVVDRGTAVATTTDFEEDIRPSHQGYDMGADEVGGCFARVLSAPDVIYGSVQQAVDVAPIGDTVQVDGVCFGVHTRSNGVDDVTQTLFVDKDLTIDGFWNYRTNITATLDAVARGRVVYIDSGVTVTLTRIVLQQGNAATAGGSNGSGGGVWNDGALILQQTHILSSTAQLGGGLYNDGVLTMTNSRLMYNQAANGGGLYNSIVGSGEARLTGGNRFGNNSATQNGGGIYQNDGILFLDGNQLYDNIANGNGGALYLVNSGDTLDVRNNFIYGNAALSNLGGGLFDLDTAVRVWHNTFVGNMGSGIYSSGSASIHSNILDSNAGAGIHTTNANPDIAYNNAYNNAPNYAGTAVAGPGSISQAPLYMDPANRDYHLLEESPGVDVGDPNLTAVGIFNDYDNDLRPTNGGPDMGADEYNSCLVQVNDQRFGVLQDAIDYAESFAPGPFPEVKIARGSCRGVFTRSGVNQVAYISQNLTLIGSLRRSNFSDPGDFYNPDIRALSTLIDAQGEGRALYIAPGATVNVSQVILANGNAYAAGGGNNGGGTYHPGPGHLLFQLVETCQSTAENGGAYYGGAGSSAYISGAGTGFCEQALFDPRTEELTGWDWFGGPSFPPFWISIPNSANNGGAHYVASGATLDIVNHAIVYNEAAQHGGGLFNAGQLHIINGGFGWNSATNNGGGIYNSGELAMYHNTLRDNEALGSGGGIYNADALVLNSSIIYANTSGSGGGGLHSTSGGTLTHNNFNANLPTESNVGVGENPINGEPGLWSGSFALRQTSRNIDQADPILLLDDDDGGVWPGGIDFDAGNWFRPDVHPTYADLNPIYGYASDVGMDEYWKEFGCAALPVPEAQNTATVFPGDVVTYTVQVINVGFPSKLIPNVISHGYTDTISITLASQTQGWSQLENGVSQQYVMDYRDYDGNGDDRVSLVLTVTVPSTATLGLQEATTVRCQSASLPSRTATAVFRTNVGLVSALEVGPSYFTNADPGAVLTFTHTITNNGNGNVEALLVPNAGAAGLSTAVVVNDDGVPISETVTINSGEFITALLRVTILETAAAREIANPGLIALDISDATNRGEVINSITVNAVSGTRHVAPGGDDTGNNCLVAQEPCATIQRAVDQAVAGDTILVAAGLYTDFSERVIGLDPFTQNVFIDKSVAIRGGYTVNEDPPFTTMAPITNAVTLSGESARRVLYISDGITVTLSGLFIRDGYIDEADGTGAGIYNLGANLTITATWVLSNSARFGSGLYHAGGDLSVHSSVFAHGVTVNAAGAPGNGAGIYVITGSVLLENNTFAGNIVVDSSRQPDSPDELGDGAAMYQADGVLTLYNNIFANNEKQAPSGSIITVFYGGSSVVANDYNLYHENSGSPGNEQTNFPTGAHDVAGDPHFIDEYYHIAATSAAKDAGTNAVSSASQVDFELDERPQGFGYDIGADERVLLMAFTFAPPTHTATIDPNTPHVYTHTITNVGDEADTYTFTRSSSSLTGAGWTHSLTPAEVTLGIGESATVTLVVTGTTPNDVDTTTILATPASNATPRSVVDTTTISGTFGVDIGPSRSGSGAPNTFVSYMHTLTNTGDLAQFGLRAVTATPPEWEVTIQPTQTALMFGNTTTIFTVTVAIPAGTPANTEHTVYVEAYALLNPATTDVLSDTTTVLAAHGLTLTPNNTSTVPAGSPAVYAHTLTNVGNIADTVTLTYTSMPAWDVTVNPPVVTNLAPGASTEVEVTVIVPPGTEGQIHVATITAQSQDVAVTATAVNTTTVTGGQGQLSVVIEPDNDGSGTAGEIVTYHHTVTNTGDIPGSFTLTAVSDQSWVVAVIPTTLNLVAGASSGVTVTVNIPPTAATNTVDVTSVTVTDLDGTATDTATNTTTVSSGVRRGVLITPTYQTGMGAAGETVTYTHRITNTGDISDSYQLVFTATWPTDLSMSDTPLLAPGAGVSLVVSVTIPGGVGNGDQDTAMITAVSTTDPSITASANDTTIANLGDVGLSFEPDREGEDDPGDVLVYHHTLTNTSDVMLRSISLTAQSSQNWNVVVDPPGIADLPVGVARPVTVTVTIPANALRGSQDVTTVAANDVLGATGIVINTTSVLPAVYNVSITPNNTGSGAPGETRVYTHTVTNTGNVTETFTLSTVSNQGWPNSVTPNTIILTPNQSDTVTVTVTIPVNAVANTTDVTTVTVSTTTPETAVTASATDTTMAAGEVPEGATIYLPIIFKQQPWCPPGVNTGVDLVVTGITVEPSAPVAGQAATVSITIRNQGTVAVTYGNNFYLDFYVDRTPTYLLVGDLVWGVQAADVGAGESATFTGSFVFGSGSHQVWAQVDTDNTVNECPFENNNVLDITINATGMGVNQNVQPDIPENLPRYTPTPGFGSSSMVIPIPAPPGNPVVPPPGVFILPTATPVPTPQP